MAGLRELGDIYKNGAEDLNEFLCIGNNEVVITEKLDAYRFSIEKRGGKLCFFKRNDSQPIDKIDRLLNDLYEKAISFFEEITPNIIRYIPENLRFGFSYFPNKKPLRTEYNKLPKNNLVLTDITQRDQHTQKIVKIYEDIIYLDRWANILEVGTTPIIFKGKIKEEQLFFIKEILDGSDKIDALFTEHITGVFGATYTKNNIIEGIVIKTPKGTAQLKDPSFKLFEQERQVKENRDFYDIIILELHNYFLKHGIPNHLSKIETDERYIECVSDIFNKFVSEGYIDPNSDAGFLQPNIVGSKGKLGIKFIQNQKTRELVQSNKLYEELFKVFLNTLRRGRKPHGLLNESTVYSLNKFIEDISNITNINILDEYSKNTDTTITSEDFNTYKNIKIETGDNSINEEVIENSNKNLLDILLPKPKTGNTNKKSPVNILVANFNPLNYSHLDIIKNGYKENNTKTIILNINTDKQPDNNFKWVISSEISSIIIEKIGEEYKKYILGSFTTHINSLETINLLLNKNNLIDKYYVNKLIIEEVQFEYYQSQVDYQVRNSNPIFSTKKYVLEKFTDPNEYKILKSLQNNTPNEFKKYVPDTVYNLWEYIYKDWFNWANK